MMDGYDDIVRNDFFAISFFVGRRSGVIKNSQAAIPLSSKVVLLITFVVFFSLFITSILITRRIDDVVEERLGRNAISISAVIANTPVVQQALDGRASLQDIENIISAVGRSSNASLAVFGMQRNLLVQYNVNNESDFIDTARTIINRPLPTSMDIENAEFSLQACSVIYGADNEPMGYVVTVMPNDLVNAIIDESIMLATLANSIGLLLGIIGAMLLARNIKDILFGLEPETIANLLQERSAMLNSVREGVLAVDRDGIITLINEEARHLFCEAGIDTNNMIGQPIDAIMESEMLYKVLETGKPQMIEQEVNGLSLITNQVPVFLEKEISGAIATFRKKTELEALGEQLTGVKTYAEALRAQTHEFMNKLHVVLGLVEMESYDELRSYIHHIAYGQQEETDYLSNRLKNTILTGFVLGKKSRARELDVHFDLTEESNLPEPLADSLAQKLVLVIGNLVDNAFDAFKNDMRGLDKTILLTIIGYQDELLITVEDSGPGIPKEKIDQIFKYGFSTKGENRGVGLHLVMQTVTALNGEIDVESLPEQGTVFSVRLPYIRKVAET